MSDKRSTVERFNFDWQPEEGGCNCSMVESEAGEYVRASDYDALHAENTRLTRLLAEAEEGIRALSFALAPDGHSVPHDCFATGPSTGDPFRDLVVCPACVAYKLAAVQRALQSNEKREA